MLRSDNRISEHYISTSRHTGQRGKLQGINEIQIVTSEPVITEANVKKLHGINEIQHKAVSQLLAHQSGRSERYPDSDFFAILLEMSESYVLSGPVHKSLIRELEKVS